MDHQDPDWLDAQYNNRARVPAVGRILQRWGQASALAREGLAHTADIAYGSGPSETLDVFPAASPDAPVLVFIHGGYWRSLDKADFSFVAPAFHAAGATVVIPNYALCPAVTIETIALQMTRALAWTWRHIDRHGGDAARIVVAGHSAGGHLAAMLMTCDWRAVADDLPAGLASRALSISGLFDLHPLVRVPFLQSDLRLTEASARRLSPALHPAPQGRLLAVAGGDESEAFLAQNALIRERWGATVVPVCETVPQRNHFDVLDPFVDPEARLHRLTLGLLGLPTGLTA
jgi:arylformamidase